jgi:hypothetical protein
MGLPTSGNERSSGSRSDPAVLAAVQEAERIFDAERKKGATAFKVEPGKKAERLETFDRTA